MQYIHTDSIINDVKNRLSSYFTANKVDESIFPRILRYAIGKMGQRVHPVKSVVLNLQSCRAELPDDFYRVCSVLLCGGHKHVVPDTGIHTEEKRVCELNMCETACDVCYDDCGNIVKVTQQIGYKVYNYDQFFRMFPSQNCRPYCTEGCFQALKPRMNQYEFEIKEYKGKKHIYTSSNEGSIYVEYQAQLMDETGFMVPDEPEVEDWIFHLARLEVYNHLYDNKEDVLQRLQMAKQDAAIAQHNAMQILNRTTKQGHYRTANILQERYAKHENWMRVTKPIRY